MPLRASAAKHSFSFLPSEEPGCGKGGKNEEIKKCYLIISKARIRSQKTLGRLEHFPAQPCADTSDRAAARASPGQPCPRPFSVRNWPGLILTLPPFFPSQCIRAAFNSTATFREERKQKRESEKPALVWRRRSRDGDGALWEELIWAHPFVFRDPNRTLSF